MRALVLVSGVILVGLVAAVLLLETSDTGVQTSLELSEALTSDTAGYAAASVPRDFRFPDDHGPHPDFRTEWWYFTGNLEGPSGRHFGYQLTFFRTALRPDSAGRSDGSWSTNQLYMAHFAVSDVAEETFRSFERFSRAAAGLAGARGSPFRVWLEDWSVSGVVADSLRLIAREEDVVVDLHLRSLKPIVLQGEDGLYRKGPGSASYYYSITRMATEGRVRLGGELYEVDGLSWMDREWSTSALAPNQEGWDWFALQLDDGRDVMYYRLRERDGATSPYSGGSIVESDGAVRYLSASDVQIRPDAYWRSERSGRRYPVAWSLRIPSHSMELTVAPYLRDQELDHAVTYWEGAVRVSGSASGEGFVELTGYGERQSSRLGAR